MKTLILIFDFDGTIANTFEYFVNLNNKLAVEYRYRKVRPDEIDQLKDKTSRDIIRFLKIPLFKVPLIAARARQELHNNIATIEPIHSLKEILSDLKSAGHLLGILTSNSRINVTRFLKNHNLEYFDFISTTTRVLKKQHGLKNLITRRKWDTENIIYIGDEIRDIEAAKKVGVRSVAVAWGYNSKKALEAFGPDFLIEDPEEFSKLPFLH